MEIDYASYISIAVSVLFFFYSYFKTKYSLKDLSTTIFKNIINRVKLPVGTLISMHVANISIKIEKFLIKALGSGTMDEIDTTALAVLDDTLDVLLRKVMNREIP